MTKLLFVREVQARLCITLTKFYQEAKAGRRTVINETELGIKSKKQNWIPALAAIIGGVAMASVPSPPFSIGPEQSKVLLPDKSDKKKTDFLSLCAVRDDNYNFIDYPITMTIVYVTRKTSIRRISTVETIHSRKRCAEKKLKKPTRKKSEYNFKELRRKAWAFLLSLAKSMFVSLLLRLLKGELW